MDRSSRKGTFYEGNAGPGGPMSQYRVSKISDMDSSFFLPIGDVEGTFPSIPGNPQRDIPVFADENVIHSPDLKRPPGGNDIGVYL